MSDTDETGLPEQDETPLANGDNGRAEGLLEALNAPPEVFHKARRGKRP